MAKKSKKEIIRGPISKSGVKRLMKEGNPDIRIKPSAVNTVVNLLEEKAKCYGKRGSQIEKERKHKTITKDTIITIEENPFGVCGSAPKDIKVTKAEIKEVAQVVTAKVATKPKGKGKGKGKPKAKA